MVLEGCNVSELKTRLGALGAVDDGAAAHQRDGGGAAQRYPQPCHVSYVSGYCRVPTI